MRGREVVAWPWSRSRSMRGREVVAWPPRVAAALYGCASFRASLRARWIVAAGGGRGLASAAATPLADWVRARGGEVHSALAVRSGQDGVELSTRTAVRAGEVLVRLPRPLQLTEDVVEPQLAGFGELAARVPGELWQARLGLSLLRERSQGRHSSFSPYIELLPAVHRGIPIFFSGDTLAMLQYAPLSEQVKKRCRWLVEFSQHTQRAGALFNEQLVDANALGWALASVSSRAFAVGTDAEGKKLHALLPMIDLANHHANNNATVTDAGDGAVELVAVRALDAHEPVLLNYGDLSNDVFLLDYGFIQHDNPCDRCSLAFDLAGINYAREIVKVKAQDVLCQEEWRQRLLGSLQLHGPSANRELLVGGADVVDPRLIGALRVLLAPPALQRKLEELGVDELADWRHKTDPALEVSVTKTALALCAIALSHFPTKLGADLSLLQDAAQTASLSHDAHLAVRFRAGKKQVLADAIAHLKVRLSDLA